MDKNNKKILLGVGAAALVVFISVGILAFVLRDKEVSNTTNISNFSTEVSSLDKKTRSEIEASLHSIIRLNNPDLDPSTIKDSFIRKDSSSTESTPSYQKGGEFIVDIPSLRQSYRLVYRTSSTPSSFDSGYPYLAFCVDEKDLIYEAFNCKSDRFSEAPENPLLEKLPHKGINYTIMSGGGNKIVVQIMLTHSQDTNKFFKNYSEAAKSWLTTEGFDLNVFTIEYRDMSNSVVSID